MLPDLHTGFSRGRSGGLVFPSLSEFSTVYCDPHSQRLWHSQIPYDYTVEVGNRFKGLDLIDRVPDELWTEVGDTVQKTRIKTIPERRRCRKAKWLSEEAYK